MRGEYNSLFSIYAAFSCIWTGSLEFPLGFTNTWKQKIDRSAQSLLSFLSLRRRKGWKQNKVKENSCCPKLPLLGRKAMRVSVTPANLRLLFKTVFFWKRQTGIVSKHKVMAWSFQELICPSWQNITAGWLPFWKRSLGFGRVFLTCPRWASAGQFQLPGLRCILVKIQVIIKIKTTYFMQCTLLSFYPQFISLKSHNCI